VAPAVSPGGSARRLGLAALERGNADAM